MTTAAIAIEENIGKPAGMTWSAWRAKRNEQKRFRRRPAFGTKRKPEQTIVDNHGETKFCIFRNNKQHEVWPIPFTGKLLFRDSSGRIYFDPKMVMKQNVKPSGR